jgi:hypothetical protein
MSTGEQESLTRDEIAATSGAGVQPLRASPLQAARTRFELISFDMETTVALDFLVTSRTHSCGQLRATDEGKTVLLMGWVHRRRDKAA